MLKKTKELPTGVICYWLYDPDKKTEGQRHRSDKLWTLVEAYPINLDGYPTVPVKTKGEFTQTRTEWDNWLYKKEFYKGSNTQYEMVPIPGRVVTHWNVESGVSLMYFNMPHEVKFLADEFGKKLKKFDNWFEFVQDGYTLYAGTARAVEKICAGETEAKT